MAPPHCLLELPRVGHESYTIGAESDLGVFASKIFSGFQFESVKNCTTNLDPLKVRAVLFFNDNVVCCRKKKV